MSDKKLYQLDDKASLGASDLIYLASADGSGDGKAAWTQLTSVLGGILASTFAASSHTHTASQITDFSTAADARISAAVGVTVQAYHANLAAFAGLTLVADRLPYANGSGTLALATFTAAGRALVDDADATAQRATLGLGTVATLSTITEANQTLADNTTGNVTSSAHGYAPKAPADATKFLNGAATPAWAQVKGSDLSMSDVTTNNVTSTAHGFAPKSPADATQFLNGAATPAFAAVKDSDLSTSDVTTNNVSTSKHGFAPKLPNDATKYLDGTGAYSVPAGGGGTGTVTTTGTPANGNLAKFSGSTSITNTTLNAFLDSEFSSTQGTVLYRGSSNWAALAVGTAGQVLQTQGASANPQWATPARVLITETTTSSSAASVTFSTIPATYRDLEIVIRGRTNDTNTNNYVDMQFNGDTGTNYSEIIFHAVNAATVITQNTAQSSIKIGQLPATSATSNHIGVIRAVVGNYRGTTFFKPVDVQFGMSTGTGSATQFAGAPAGQWRSTSAITQVLVKPDGATFFIDGTVVSLYGLM